ncbi:hypothetical protein OBBRIDRAFT_835417 [Obba rivulosa]|uniref:Uncharacterized protein n=1 Tax=Obba rivulosa TaxID=1052685 RepID=A0A8E2DJ30_9APHY|nr:hypothetical protein OBBRIDRAFT_835417 [Obba rivulosa]
MLQALNQEHAVEEQFYQALDEWKTHGKRELYPDCRGWSQEAYGDHEHDLEGLQTVFARFWGRLDTAHALISSSVVTDKCLRAFRSLGARQHALPFTLPSRKRTGLTYTWKAVFRFFKDGIPLSDNSAQPVQPRPAVRFLQTPTDYVRSFIESTFPHTCEAEAIDALLRQEVIAWAWTTDDVIISRLHPEVQLVSHFLRKSVTPHSSCIGTSRPTCWACQKYLQIAVMPPEYSSWHYSERCNRMRCDQRVPSSSEGCQVAMIIETYLREGLERHLDIN